MSKTPETKSHHSLTVQVNGVSVEVFMSFALLNRLAYLVGNPDHTLLILTDPALREVCLKELLAERSKSGRVIAYQDVEDMDISLDDVQELLSWATDHVTVFTMAAAEKVAAHALRHQDRLLNLTSTANGLANLASQKSAA